MDEILKKIDEEIVSIRKILVTGTFTEEVYGTLCGKLQMAERIKEIVLSEQSKPLTIGDKIRESNESLADEIHEVLNGQDCDSNCPAYSVCDIDYADNCKQALIKYFNQPSTTSSLHQK